MRGAVSSAWCSVSSAASCSPRTSALPRGIITAASHLRRESAPRKAWSRLNSCSSCLYGEADMTCVLPAGSSSPREGVREGLRDTRPDDAAQGRGEHGQSNREAARHRPIGLLVFLNQLVTSFVTPLTGSVPAAVY